MGAWGPALFSDDVGCDVRDEYRALIEDGLDDDAATRRILGSYAEALGDADDGPVVWLALAVTQSKIGRLDPAVAKRALRIIASGEGMSRWRELGHKEEAKRTAALEKARAQITGPQPPRRRLRPPWRHITSLQPGDALSYRTLTGTCLLFRVARIEASRFSVAPILVLLDHAAPSIPKIRKIAKIRDRPEPPRNYSSLHQPWGKTSFHIMVCRKSDPDHVAAGFPVVGSIGPRAGDAAITLSIGTQWSQFGALLDGWMSDRPL